MMNKLTQDGKITIEISTDERAAVAIERVAIALERIAAALADAVRLQDKAKDR